MMQVAQFFLRYEPEIYSCMVLVGSLLFCLGIHEFLSAINAEPTAKIMPINRRKK